MGFLTDNYNILNELGRGGMGAVYLATDKRLDRKVAIKTLLLSESLNLQQKSEIIARFQKEARAIAKLSHPNIVGIHDIGEEDGKHFMVMEFLEGKSLGAILEEEAMLPIEKSIEISIQMCRALNYIHSNSIVHRDIKPDNIILVSDKLVKLTDFGIAQNESDQLRLTQDGAILGSIMYISPEQLRNSKEVDNRADIYSYGVTFYQMLTGQMPFDGSTVGEVVTKILSETPELIRNLNKSIPYELEAIVMKAMNKDREKRYKSADEMERDLQNLISAHAFKKSTNVTNNIKVQTDNLKNTSNLKSNTNTITKVVVEKASTNEKIIRVVFRTVFSIIIVSVAFNILASFLTYNSVIETTDKLSGNMIQGPSSRYILESSLNFKVDFICIFLALLSLFGLSFVSPIESKGIHRNNNIKAEILPLSISLVIVSIYTFMFLGGNNSIKDFEKAFKNDSNGQIETNDLLSKKGELSYSNIDDYKRNYKKLTKEKKSSIYDDSIIQLKDNVFDGDYIKLNQLKKITTDDHLLNTINDLLTNAFIFNEPPKDAYVTKIGSLLNTISEGRISNLPNEVRLNISKDIATGKVSNVNIDWDKNRLTLKPSFISLESDQGKFVYPKPTEKTVNLTIDNSTANTFMTFLYSIKDNKFIKDFTILSNKNEAIKVREGEEYALITIFKEKTAIPQAGKFTFSDGDLIKLDKIYYETQGYYNLDIKSFPDNKVESQSKINLKDQGLFITRDADINLFKLSEFRKQRL